VEGERSQSLFIFLRETVSSVVFQRPTSCAPSNYFLSTCLVKVPGSSILVWNEKQAIDFSLSRYSPLSPSLMFFFWIFFHFSVSVNFIPSERDFSYGTPPIDVPHEAFSFPLACPTTLILVGSRPEVFSLSVFFIPDFFFFLDGSFLAPTAGRDWHRTGRL